MACLRVVFLMSLNYRYACPESCATHQRNPASGMVRHSPNKHAVKSKVKDLDLYDALFDLPAEVIADHLAFQCLWDCSEFLGLAVMSVLGLPRPALLACHATLLVVCSRPYNDGPFVVRSSE